MNPFEGNLFPVIRREQNARSFVLALLLVAAHLGFGQHLSQKPINRALGSIHIVLGCEGVIKVGETNELVVRSEVTNIDQLTNNMIDEIKLLLLTDSARIAFDMEQKFWLQERSKYCKFLSKSTPSDVPKLVDLECRKWATTCRLEEMLVRYDAIIAGER